MAISVQNLPQFSKGLTIQVVGSSYSYHTFNNWNLRQLSTVYVSDPKPKTHVITEVMGIDGDIDITENFGDIKFENRELQYRFDSLDTSYEAWMNRLRGIMNAVHGRKCKITADHDPGYYWVGRVYVVPDSKSSNNISTLTIKVDAHPRMFITGTTGGGVI